MKMKKLLFVLFGLTAFVATTAQTCTAQEQDMFRSIVAQRRANPVADAINGASATFGLSRDGLAGLAGCESGMDVNARNGTHHSLFQHKARYWPGRVADYNAKHDPDVSAYINDPYSQSYVTAYMIKSGGLGPWECRSCYYNPNGKRCHPSAWKGVVYS